jgi:hypothetical protein
LLESGGDGELHQFNPDGTGAISAAHFEFDKFEALFFKEFINHYVN